MTMALTLAFLAGQVGCVSALPQAPDTARTGPLKLLFSGTADVMDTWGRLHFGVTPVQLIRKIAPAGFSVLAGFPLADGSWEIFGHQTPDPAPGDAPDRSVTWKLVRGITRDGAAVENVRTVFESEKAAWSGHCALARNGDTGEYLLLRLRIDDSGFAYTAFVSHDGSHWSEQSGNPLFYDGDSMSLFWSPVLHRFVCVSKSFEPVRKRFVDHGGTTPAWNDNAWRDRRVLMIRTSPDGRRWEPSVSLPDVWNRGGKKAPIPTGYLTTPDSDDPPDLEFYSGNAFWYHDRAYMTVLNYAASPLSPGKHGPQLDNEWWVSQDGLRWERPARGVNALDVFPQLLRLDTTHPLVVGGQILFPKGDRLLGLPADRITYVAARANAEFTTRRFEMPRGDLLLNAAVPSLDRPFARDQAYVMVAVLDEAGTVIPGFEAQKCVIHGEDRPDIPLRWGDASAGQLAGRKVRLRFMLRSASIYAVTAAPGQTEKK